MNEKRYVVKTREAHYYTGGELWVGDLQRAKVFDGIQQILRETSWIGYSYPTIIEVERVPQPKWREKREL